MGMLIGLKSFAESSFQLTIDSTDVIAIATLSNWL